MIGKKHFMQLHQKEIENKKIMNNKNEYIHCLIV